MNATRSRIRQATTTDAPALQPLLEELAGIALDQATVLDRMRMVDASPIDELYVIEDSRGIQGLLAFRESEAHHFYETLGYQKTGYRFVKGIH